MLSLTLLIVLMISSSVMILCEALATFYYSRLSGYRTPLVSGILVGFLRRSVD